MSTAVLERPVFEAASGLWDDDESSVEEESVSPLDALSRSDGEHESEKLDPAPNKLLFNELADELAEATQGLSSTRRANRHPAYQEILALGDQAIPWLLVRLETSENRPLWLRLLASLTHFRPGAGHDTISEAAAAWIAWGKLRNNR